MKKFHKFSAILCLTSMLASCGGGGTGSSAVTPTTPTTTTSSDPCSLLNRQNATFSAINEWYLFPDTLPASLNPAPYTTVQNYIDAIVATARAQSKDRGFTYITSIAEENALINSGSSAGFGVRLSLNASQRLFISEAFETAPAFAAGIDRGTEITAIGNTPSTMRLVSDIIAAEGSAGLNAALGPSTAGLARTLRITTAGTTRDVTVTKADYSLEALSGRYGAKILTDGTKKVGYINMRTFIVSSASNQLISAFANFKAQGVTELIIDFRYNGGGLVSVAETMGDLLGGGRSTNDVFSITGFRSEKSANNGTKRFAPRAESIAPTKVAFITTSASASASELVPNAMIPYLGNNMAIVGSNSYGKPVGQIAVDRTACDDRLRVVAFATLNAANNGAYYTGLASVVPNSCAAADDVTFPLGDPNEASVKGALDFLAGRACTRITASDGKSAQSVREANQLIYSETPTAAQHEIPGLF